MSLQRHGVRPGTYCDSVVLMRLQGALEIEPGILSAAAVMATPANREILEQGDLWSDELLAYRPDDLLIVVRAESPEQADAALARVDELLNQRQESRVAGRRYRGLAAALAEHPEARWVALSIPGVHAAAVARDALEAERNVFLYSDNVSLDDEVSLKETAVERGLLVLGPDCGSTILGGIGFGFSNRVARGPVGLVGASGTGLQAVSCRLDELGVGVSQMIGTGGRDLSQPVAARTTRQALDLLARDPATEVIALVSKPPAAEVATALLAYAAGLGKPVVVGFVGGGSSQSLGTVDLAGSLEETARLAAERVTEDRVAQSEAPSSGRLVGLFSGGTLALEIALALARWLAPLATNLGVGLQTPNLGVGLDPAPDAMPTEPPRPHTILDLGADEYTVGRPHPMIDGSARREQFSTAAEDPSVGTLLLDVVLGDGAHADPAGELSPTIAAALATAAAAERPLRVGILLVGSQQDPQDLGAQRDRLEAAGAMVFTSIEATLRWLAAGLLSRPAATEPTPRVSLEALEPPSVINLGLESFADSLITQGAPVIPVDWRPPAGGNARLADILQRMKKPS